MPLWPRPYSERSATASWFGHDQDLCSQSQRDVPVYDVRRGALYFIYLGQVEYQQHPTNVCYPNIDREACWKASIGN